MINLIKKQFYWLYYGVINAIRVRDLRVIFSCDIRIKLRKGTKIPHPIGIVIGSGVILGRNCTILQNVTIGIKHISDKCIKIKIGNNVIIGSGAALLGEIVIGNNVIIGANSVVTKNVPANCTIVGIPAKIIKIHN